MHDKVMGRTQTSFTEVSAQSLSADDRHGKIIGRTQTGLIEVYAQSLSADCDLDIWPSNMVLVHDTSSFNDNHFAKLFSNPFMHSKLMGRTQTSFTEVSAQSLSADCDRDLCPSNMVFVRDTLSCHYDHLCQIIFRSHHA